MQSNLSALRQATRMIPEMSDDDTEVLSSSDKKEGTTNSQPHDDLEAGYDKFFNDKSLVKSQLDKSGNEADEEAVGVDRRGRSKKNKPPKKRSGSKNSRHSSKSKKSKGPSKAKSGGIVKQPTMKEKKVMMDSDSDSFSVNSDLEKQKPKANEKQVVMMSSSDDE